MPAGNYLTICSNGINMKKILLLIIPVLFVLSNNSYPQDLTKYVDPFIGTAGHGHTYPGAVMPFGMVQVSPDTRTGDWDACSGYYYSDNSILGFSHTHLSGTGSMDYADILFMPTTGKIRLNPGDKNGTEPGYRSRFNHSSEKAEPGYYSVVLSDYSIKAELTATTRAAFHRYTYPSGAEANLIIDLMHQLENSEITKEIKFRVIDKNKIEGMRRSQGWAQNQVIYFTAEFSEPIIDYGIEQDGKILAGASNADGNNIKAFLKFRPGSSGRLLVKVGISAVDNEGSALNLKTEIPSWDFDSVRLNAKAAWNKELSSVVIKDESDYKKRIFYTSLYHAFVVPNIFFDVDRRYPGNDFKIHTCSNFDNYTIFSLWDTFRSTHPLYVLLNPERAGNMVKTLLAKYDEGGMLPKWELAGNETNAMIGYHSVPVIVDAYIKGIRSFDTDKALKAMLNSAYNSDPEMKYYKELGFVPADRTRSSVSKTLEYSYDDWCIYTMAKALGKNDIENEFLKRGQYYTNLFDGSTGFFRGRNSDGSWCRDFNPFEFSTHYTEGNAWQYSMFVPQDMNGLIQQFGGIKNTEKHLNKLFASKLPSNINATLDVTGLIGQYAHGNEPSHHIAYIYNFLGQPWKTQETIHRIINTMYTDKPDGLAGNEDCGQMSSWFNFSSMGFYPFCPGTDEYQIGTPSFKEVTINLAGGKTFIIKAENLSDKNYYIQSAKLNGKPLTEPFIKHSDITSGGELVLVMGSAPGKKCFTQSTIAPYSLSRDNMVSIPYLKKDISAFRNEAVVEAGCFTPGAAIHYTIDGSEPTEKSALYSHPFKINKNTRITIKAFKKGFSPSTPAYYDAVKTNLIKAKEINLSSLSGGVNYFYFEKGIDSLAQMPLLSPDKKGIIDNFSLSPAVKQDGYGFVYEVYIKVPEDGIYVFAVKSNSGSILTVDNTEAANSNGDFLEDKYIYGHYMGLSKGFHPIKLYYYNYGGKGSLDAVWGKINEERSAISTKDLYHLK
jgi:predicted alpha-1,2-mannosidase